MKTVQLEYEVYPRPWHGGNANPLIADLFETYRSRYVQHLQYFTSIRHEFAELSRDLRREAPHMPYWDNGFLPGLDIVALHSLLKQHNPATLLEVGSGNSTMVARRAIRMNGLRTRIVSVGPYPRADIDTLCDAVIRTPLQDVAPGNLPALRSGDFIFFDGSHHAYMNSDVTAFFLEMLPRLPAGVFVQVHDICLPYDYPASWTGRFYSEQYVLGAALLYGPERFAIELPNMFISKHAELASLVHRFWSEPTPIDCPHKHGASFWFRTTGDATANPRP